MPDGANWAEDVLQAAKELQQVRENFRPLAQSWAAFYLELVAADIDKPEAVQAANEFMRGMLERAGLKV